MNSTWMKGTIILTFTAFLTKVLSMVYKIPYQNIVGDEGLYVFQQIYPLIGIYTLLNGVVLPTIISDLLLTYQYSESIKQYIKRSLWLFSVVSFGLLYLGSNSIALLMGDVQLNTAIKIVAIAFLVIPPLAYLRGIAQANESSIHRLGYSITIEQLVRVAMIIWVLVQFQQFNIYQIANFSFLLGLIGPIIALVYLSLLKVDYQPANFLKLTSKPKIFKKSLFLFFSAGILIVFQLIDSFLVYNSLVLGGASAIEGMQLKGIYDRGLPIIQATTFFGGAIVSSIIPQLSKLKEEKQKNNVFNSALFFVIAFSIPACVGLFTIIEDLNIVLFTNNLGSQALKIMTLQVLFYPFVFLTTAILQQEDKYALLLVSVLAGAFVKLMTTAPLTQSLGINGAAISTVLALGTMSIISLIQFRSMIYKQSFLNLLKSLISTLAMWVAIDYLSPIALSFIHTGEEQLFYISSLVAQVTIGILIYATFMLLFIFTSKPQTSAIKRKKRRRRRKKDKAL